MAINKSIVGDKSLNSCITKFIEILNQKAPLPWGPEVEKERNIIFHTLALIIDKFDERIAKDATLVQLADSIVVNINAIPDWSLRSRGSALLYRLYKIMSDPKKSELASLIQQFYTNATPLAIKECGELMGGAENLFDIGPHAAILEKRGIAEPAIFDIAYPTLKDKEKTKWILLLIDSNLAEGLRRLGLLQLQIPEGQMITKRLLDMAPNLPVTQRHGCYDVCIAVRCNDNAELVAQFSGQLLTLLKTADTASQKLGTETVAKVDFLQKEIRRSMAKDIFDWIESQPSASRYQPYSLEYLFTQLDHLNIHEKEKLSDICFDELIVRSNNLNALKLGFRILAKLKTMDADWSKNYMDIKAYYGQTTDASTKTELLNGLKHLRPEQIIEHDQEFWEWYDSLQSN